MINSNVTYLGVPYGVDKNLDIFTLETNFFCEQTSILHADVFYMDRTLLSGHFLYKEEANDGR